MSATKQVLELKEKREKESQDKLVRENRRRRCARRRLRQEKKREDNLVRDELLTEKQQKQQKEFENDIVELALQDKFMRGPRNSGSDTCIFERHYAAFLRKRMRNDWKDSLPSSSEEDTEEARERDFGAHLLI
jgi:hypothetical protein